MGCTSSDAGTATNPQAGKGGMSNDVIEVSYFGIGHGRASGIKLMLAHCGANWKFNAVE